jgi:hypothetical protein
MDKKQLIAEALLEIATDRSETTFIDETDDMISAAKKLNLVLPSPDLAVIKTVYAEVDKPNKNGVVLQKEAAVKGLPTLVGKQINWEHDGAGRVCGYIIDAKINEDDIEIIGVIFKSLFPEEMKKVKERFAAKKLAVSFEIWSRDPETKESVVHVVGNHYSIIDPIIYHGCGLLLVHPSACPKAIVYKLEAKTEIENAEQIINKVFSEDLVFASLAIKPPKCRNCETCNCGGEKVDEIFIESDYDGGEIEEAKKLTTEQRNALPDSDFALIQEKDGKKVRRFPINDEAHVRNALARLPQAKDISEEERKSTLEKILKRAKELNMTELLKKYEKADENPKTEETTVETQAAVTSAAAETTTEVIPPVAETQAAEAVTETVAPPIKLVRIVSESTVITEEIPNEDGSFKTSRKGMNRRTREMSDGTKTVEEEQFDVVNTYTQAQVEEKVNAIKAEKDAEIATLKAEQEVVIKAKDEKIETQTKELGLRDQEIAKLTPPVETAEQKPVKTAMEVGIVETAAVPSETKRRASEIDKLIAQKHQENK